jgi:integration host factor subunit beta
MPYSENEALVSRFFRGKTPSPASTIAKEPISGGFASACQKYTCSSFGEALGMTKADLVEEVSQLGDLTRRDGEVIVDTIFDSVIGALKSGDKIEIRGFGSFRIRQRKPRIGRNPKTGSRVDVPAKRVPYFKPSKELRDLVNPNGKRAPTA